MAKPSCARVAAFLLVQLVSMAFAASSRAQMASETIGDLRVQVYSPTLIRIEQRGPKGFEDRPTFHVAERQWPGEPCTRRDDADSVTLTHLDGTGHEDWSLRAPAVAADATGVVIKGANGEMLWSFDPARATASVWLPGPQDFVPAMNGRVTSWSFADTPRLVPPAWGATPPPTGEAVERSPTSGWDVSNDARDLYVFLPGAGGYARLREDVVRLVGRTPMPPAYMLGFIDSRYYAYTQQSALERIDEYHRRGFPLDMLVIDTDWRVGASHGYDVDRALFPDMEGFLSDAHRRNVRIMFNDHPEPKFPGALDPGELTYRRDNLDHWLRAGVDVWWYDRNWNVGLVEPGRGLRREVWGMRLYRDITMAAWRSIDEAAPARPVIMANVDGIDNGRRNRPSDVSARLYPIQWTGDTSATWAFLRAGVDNALYEGVHALNAYISEDLGGHVGRPDEELYVRFVQYGAFSPVMRLHCTKGADRTPWSYGPGVEEITREYAKLRERLMPVLYTAARRNHDTGEPIVRRLDLEFPGEAGSARGDEYLLGDDLLVAPIVNGSSEGVPVPTAWLDHKSAPGLAAEYFANATLEGPAVVMRSDPSVNFDWGLGSPAPGIPPDRFSVRWTGTIAVPPDAAPVRLAVSADDGVRLWIDGERVIDGWKPQAETLYRSDRALEPGKRHEVRVEYFELEHDAVCRLLATPGEPQRDASREVWIPPGGWIDAWTGARYQGPRAVRCRASLGQIPLFLREGSVVPLAPDMSFASQKPWDHLTLEVSAPPRGSVVRELYEDDTRTIAYLSGQCRITTLRVETDPDQRRIRVAIDPVRAPLSSGPASRVWTIALRPPVWAGSVAPASLIVDGEAVDPHKARVVAWPVSPLGLAPSLGETDGARAHDVQRLEIDLPAGAVSTGRIVEVGWPPTRK